LCADAGTGFGPSADENTFNTDKNVEHCLKDKKRRQKVTYHA
jgi:hypothetical protein